MITIKTKKDIEILKEGGKILAKTLKEVSKMVKPGVCAKDLEDFAYKFIIDHDAKPAFLNYSADFMEKPFPATLCVSKNDIIVHGVPTKDLIFYEGDIVSIDCGLIYKNLYTDSAVTVGVGKVSKEHENLMKVTKESLFKGIKMAKKGNTLGDIGHAIQTHIEKNGFSVIKELIGHGVGYQLHEEPEVYNFGIPNSGIKLQAGYVLALEPMATKNETNTTQTDNDEFKTANDEYAAHFEHTIVVTDGEPIVVTKS